MMPGESVGDERFFNVREAAERLSLRPWSIYQMIGAGHLTVHRVGTKGRTLRIAESDLAEYLRRRRSPATNGNDPRAT